MFEQILKKLKEMKKEVPEAFGIAATEEEIIESERQLGGRLPEKYRRFLNEVGSGAVGEAIVMGLSSPIFTPTHSIIDVSKEYRREFSQYKNLVVIGVDGAGNFIGFLLGDSEVVFTYDHDFGGYYKIAENFEDYIDKALKRELNICF